MCSHVDRFVSVMNVSAFVYFILLFKVGKIAVYSRQAAYQQVTNHLMILHYGMERITYGIRHDKISSKLKTSIYTVHTYMHLSFN
jgi:hypothetical protein